MTVYPTTETYLINWMGGTGGAFLTTLVSSFLYDVENYETSEYGNSHDGLLVAESNWCLESKLEYNKVLHKEPIHLHVTPKDHTKPFILFDHAIPNIPALLEQYPLAKVFTITVEKKDAPRIRGNMYYKVLCQYYDPWDGQWWSMQNKSPYLKKFFTPMEADVETVKRYIEDSSIGFDAPDYYDYDTVQPTCVTKIKYNDLIHRPEKVLSILSSVLGKPILDSTKAIYQKYLDSQDLLIKTKLPWIDDK